MKGGWRALVLLGISASGPLDVRVLLGIPFACLALLLPPRRLEVVLLGVLVIVSELLIAPGLPPGTILAQAGWVVFAGTVFAVISGARPESPFVGRGLAAIGAATVATALVLAVEPSGWSIVEGSFEAKLGEWTAVGLAWLRPRIEDPDLWLAMEEGWREGIALQLRLLPSTAALLTLSGLGAVWWLWARLSGGIRVPLAPLRDFRFHDGLVWLLVAGSALSLPLFAARVQWVGLNLAAFMGVLYAVRGAAVVALALAGVSTFVGGMLILAGVLFAPGSAIALALVGLGDTWIDLRERLIRNRGGDRG